MVARPGARNALCVADQGRRNPLLSRTIGYYSVCHCTLAFFPFFYFEEIKERISQGCEGFSPRNLRRLRWFLRKSKLNFIYSSFPTARSRGVALNSVFHTFFLPKRERKYQRKRFRAAARTPRGHRGCSALSALEIGRRLQRCYCSSQNEALAPLPWRKTYVFGCRRNIPPKPPEGKRAFSRKSPLQIII